MTGELFDGREAARLGLVNRAVPGDQVLPTAEALARTIMAKAPIPTVGVLTKFEDTEGNVLGAMVYEHRPHT